MSYSFFRSLALMLVGILGMGFLPIVDAKVVWVKARDTGKSYCPEVCQVTKKFHSKNPAFNVPYAVPAGINPRATKARGSEQVYYVCATNFAGWRVGFNIEYARFRCYTGFRKSEHYGEYYYCLCSDEPMEPIQ